MRQAMVWIAVMAFAAVTCRKDIGKARYGNYPYAVGKIISTHCSVAGCHNSQSSLAASGLNLESWESLGKGSLSGSPVIPYSTRFSSLCYFVNSYADLGPINMPRMPLNRDALSREEVKAIKDWVNAGAPNESGEILFAYGPARKKLYAVNQGCSVVTVIDAETQLPIRYIDVGTKGGTDTPHQVRVSPDGLYWYVIFINNNILQKYSCLTDQLVAQIPLTPAKAGTGTTDALNWNTFVISKNGKRAYAVSWSESGAIAAVDLEHHTLQHYMAFVYNPHGVVLNSGEDKIYVTAQKGNYIMEVDTALTSRNNLSLENGLPANQNSVLDAHDILLSPNKHDLWITCQSSNEVRVYDLRAAAVTSILPCGLYPQEIVYASGTDAYYVACMNDTTVRGTCGSVTRLSASNPLDRKILPCGFQPHGICVEESKGLIYVLSRNQSSKGPPPHHSSQCAGKNGFMNFIDLQTFILLEKKYELSVDPYFICPQP